MNGSPFLGSCVRLCSKFLFTLKLFSGAAPWRLPRSPSPAPQVTYQFEVRRCILEKQDQGDRFWVHPDVC